MSRILQHLVLFFIVSMNSLCHASPNHPTDVEKAKMDQAAAKKSPLTASKNLAEIVANDPSFSKFEEAVITADLVKMLRDSGPYTLFIPNNAAFGRLPLETWKHLLKPESRDELAAILTYHTIPTRVMSSDFKNMKLGTVNGKDLEIHIQGAEITVNGAKILKTDIMSSNGVIHVIDAVLLP